MEKIEAWQQEIMGKVDINNFETLLVPKIVMKELSRQIDIDKLDITVALFYLSLIHSKL